MLTVFKTKITRGPKTFFCTSANLLSYVTPKICLLSLWVQNFCILTYAVVCPHHPRRFVLCFGRTCWNVRRQTSLPMRLSLVWKIRKHLMDFHMAYRRHQVQKAIKGFFCNSSTPSPKNPMSLRTKTLPDIYVYSVGVNLKLNSQ